MNTNYAYNLGLLWFDVQDIYSDRVAIHSGVQKQTYKQVNAIATNLAKKLIDLGVASGDVILIAHEKDTISYCAMIAAITLGVTYVNLDVEAPAHRLKKIVDVSQPKLIVYADSEFNQKLESLAFETSIDKLCLKSKKFEDAKRQDIIKIRENCAKVDGSTIAYIMFTSGSTGTPKGVAVTHQNLLHFIAWSRKEFGITPDDNFANLSPMYFDNSVFDFYSTFFSGASITPISRRLLSSPYDLVDYVDQKLCTIWFSVPSALMFMMTMKAFKKTVPRGLRRIIFGGEGYPKEELTKLYQIFKRQATLTNVYGPTECTCICSAHEISDDDFEEMSGLPSLGKLNQNFDFKIVDGDGQSATKGELVLIGPNVAAGYFNDLEKTFESFITISDENRFMKKGYRTGDIVKEVSGDLFFVGRVDNQIKHMGYRIELEEIEVALNNLTDIDQAAVIYSQKSVAFGKIIAFVASNIEIKHNKIISQLRELLPEYMMPHVIMVMSSLPKNANGKVDRKKLADQFANKKE